MKRWIRLSLFLLASLLILAVVFAKVFLAEQARRYGTLYRFSITGYDPYDPFCGRYLAIRMPSVATLPDNEFPPGFESGGSGFVQVTTGENGEAKFVDFTLSRPESGDFLRVTNCHRSYQWERQNDDDPPLVSFSSPYSRFYLNEKLAPGAEKALNDALSGNRGKVELLLRVYKGNSCVEDLLIDGVPVREAAARSESL